MTKQNALHPNHTNDESVKEMHSKKAANVHPHRTVMEAMIVAAVEYESVCSNACAVAEAAGLVYAPPTPAEYETLIDRAANAVHLHTNLPAGLEAHQTLVDPWFETNAGFHFATAAR